MSALQRKKNRIISFVCIGFFAMSLVISGVIVSKLVNTIVNYNTLQKIKNQLIEEKEKLEDGEEKDCFTVYVKDEYTLYNGEIYIFNK